MIEKLILSNFKGFKDKHEINLAPLNFVFGQNSAGKSAIVQAFSLLNQSQQDVSQEAEPLNFLGPEIDLGGFKNVIFNHDTSKELTIGLQIKNIKLKHWSEYHVLLDSYFTSTKIEFDFKWNENNKECFVNALRIDLIGKDVIQVNLDRIKDPNSLTLKTIDKNSFELASKLKKLFAQIIKLSEVQEVSSYGNYPSLQKYKTYFNKKSDSELALDLEKDVITGFLSFQNNFMEFNYNSWFKLQEIKEKYLNTNLISIFVIQLLEFGLMKLSSFANIFQHIGPVRPDPERIYFNNSPGNKMVKELLKESKFLQAINSTLSDMNIPYQVKVQKIVSDYHSAGEYNSLSFIDTRTNTEVSGKDIGYGISQILPIIYQTIATTFQSTFLTIEQPELHLHPRVQLELANFFTKILKLEIDDDQINQILIETHSENMILRIQNLVKSGVLSSDEVQIIFVGSSDNIGSWHKEIKLLPDGQLADEWPGGFFTERIEEWGS